MRQLLFNIDALHTCDDAGRSFRKAHVVVEDGQVAAVGAGTPEGEFDRRIDLAGCIVLPGFVNLHHHFFQTLTRAIPRTLRGHLIDWLRMMYPIWAGMTPEHLASASRATMAELMLTGATTTVDHAYLMPRCDPVYADAIVDSAERAGMRLHLVRGSITALEGALEAELTPMLGPRAGGIIDDRAAVLADMAHTARRYHAPGHGSRLTIGFGPTTTTYEDLDYMARVAALAQDHGCGLHIHFHPRADERAVAREKYGAPPIDLLRRAGWLRPGTFFAHGTRLDAYDQSVMAETGVALAHCPRMVVRLGARCTPVHEFRAQKIPVGIGVDGGASNDSGSMLGEIRLALLLHRVAGGEGTVSFEQWLDPADALMMATRIPAQIIGRSDIGHLSVGACADITAFDMRGVGFAGARTDLLAGLLLAGDDTRAALTMIGGAIKVRDGRLVDDDEFAIRQAVDEATAALIGRAAGLTGLDYSAYH
jgi:cytosine/adenosine deaminase-related metal-dependent hydrolase